MEDTKDNLTNNIRFCEIDINENEMRYSSAIDQALIEAEIERALVTDKYEEFAKRVGAVTPDCDKLDYALAASSGALCGILDIFCVGFDPKTSLIGKKVDEWTKSIVEKFAKKHGCNSLSELEKKYEKIPYDQTRIEGFPLSPTNHHFKSLAHNPTLLGLFFSILDQFQSQSTFVFDGELITFDVEGDKTYLVGHNFAAKLFCGFTNWIGHLMSDVSGSSSSHRRGTRGMGIPSPLLCFSNDIIAIKAKLKIKASEFDKAMNNMAVKLFTKGYDARFATAKAIPVLINDLLTRLLYSIKRLISYFSSKKKTDFSFPLFWKEINPFSSPSLNRALLVARGTFCAVNLIDSVVEGIVKGGTHRFALVFLMRLNIKGLGKFVFSLLGEAIQAKERVLLKPDYNYWVARKEIVDDYISVLASLKNSYGSDIIKSFINDLKKEEIVAEFEKRITDYYDSSLRLVQTIDDFQTVFSGINAIPLDKCEMNNNIKMNRINWEKANQAIINKELRDDRTVSFIDQFIIINNKSIFNPSQVNTYMMTGVGGLIVSSGKLALFFTPYIARFFVSRTNEKRKKRIRELAFLIENKYYKKYQVALLDLCGRIESMKNNEMFIISCTNDIKSFGTDYDSMSIDQKKKIDECLESITSSIDFMIKPIASLKVDYSDSDYILFLQINNNSKHLRAYKECQNFIVSYANCFYGLKMERSDWKLLWEIVEHNPNAICNTGLKKEYNPVPYYLIDGVRIAIRQKNEYLKKHQKQPWIASSKK